MFDCEMSIMCAKFGEKTRYNVVSKTENGKSHEHSEEDPKRGSQPSRLILVEVVESCLWGGAVASLDADQFCAI